VPLLDLQAQLASIRQEVMSTIERVVDSQMFIMGENVTKLEEQIAAYSTSPYAIGCASGSDALLLALMAYDIGPGDEVLTVPYTFFATVGAICRAGATPVFVDVEPDTYNMDMSQVAAVLEKHPKIRAIIPIHLFGGCADMDALNELVKDRGIAVIEDAAQSIGSEYKGKRAGSLGDMACFSFFPSKNLGCYGDGGMLTTNDQALAEKLTALRVHGTKRKYYHDYIGINSRLDALQAAVLRVKFRHLDGWSEKRQQNADLYRALFEQMDIPVKAPVTMAYQTRHVYNQFAIQCAGRDALQGYLKERGIGSEVYYPLPLHLQKCFAHLGHQPNDFPVSERLAQESLALPIFPELQAAEIESVCDAIRTFYADQKSL